MAQITAALIKELRDRTMAGMADCKKALEETGGDLDKAAEWLRKKGITKASQAMTRIATEGAIASYIHMGGKIGVLVEINCQTDFVARTDDFKAFCKDVAMHIAGRDPYPLYVSEDEIPKEVYDKEYQLQLEKAREQAKGKPESIVQKIVEGQMAKWKKDICLLDQEFIKDPQKDVRTLMLELSAKTGEKISIRRFTRYALGEGLQKKSEDFAREVEAQLQASQKAQ
ncbi:MAG: translation elongation factor Ts [Myxococcales bacterium]|nr:translation elongation factor Ts [Myxococcota bacterium]MDW8284037.1 translation elongation factor Ts [Myxococcales bacterium]